LTLGVEPAPAAASAHRRTSFAALSQFTKIVPKNILGRVSELPTATVV
jgi:hypothetical protein